VVGCGGDDNGAPDGSSDVASSKDGGRPDVSSDAPVHDSAKPDGDAAQDVAPQDGKVDSSDTGPADAGPETVTALTSAGAFTSIFDAVPDATGTTVYFTAINSAGAIGVFSVPAAGGAPTTVLAGAPFIAPFGITISSDGNTLYVADPGIESANDLGEILSLPTSGGATTAIAGTGDLLPRGVTITNDGSEDTLVFTGIDGTTGAQGVFKIAPAGGTATTVAEGSPFVDPSGIAADALGNFYVMDTEAAASHRGALIKIASTGVASALVTNLWVGYPAGIAVTLDGEGLIVSGLAGAEGPDTISSFPVLGDASTPFVPTGLSGLSNAAGLHRAAKANFFAFVDSAGDGTDAVYAIK
jgi:sugar lactone lactonase YvrE